VAGLIRAPSALSPWSNLDGAIARSRVVLRLMVEHGFHHARTRAGGPGRPRGHPAVPAAGRGARGYAKEYLRQQFRNHFGGDHPPEWQVHTTFLPAIQDAAEQAVEAGLRRTGHPDPRGRACRLDPRTGHVLALVGGRDYRTSPFNRATRSRRQPGSAFKPFVYATALEERLLARVGDLGLNQVTFSGSRSGAPTTRRQPRPRN